MWFKNSPAKTLIPFFSHPSFFTFLFSFSKSYHNLLQSNTSLPLPPPLPQPPPLPPLSTLSLQILSQVYAQPPPHNHHRTTPTAQPQTGFCAMRFLVFKPCSYTHTQTSFQILTFVTPLTHIHSHAIAFIQIYHNHAGNNPSMCSWHIQFLFGNHILDMVWCYKQWHDRELKLDRYGPRMFPFRFLGLLLLWSRSPFHHHHIFLMS